MRDLQSKQNGFSHIPRLINPTSSTSAETTMRAARAAEAAAAFPQGAGRRRRRGRGRRDEPEASSAISSSSSAYRNESGGASGEGEELLYTPPSIGYAPPKVPPFSRTGQTALPCSFPREHSTKKGSSTYRLCQKNNPSISLARNGG